ncbi:hypothetical protein GUJ93_ZPchr0004g39437 [Zizania palustris]|uniref:Uncharacterized protein n=1 Tax=Zizania palustris TaxID=103762 RepID=A0A8J5S0R9_ZIZPA|nr:hypothetical protein GUJ93_ZPchr0004g39437 [Zizania palustris]
MAYQAAVVAGQPTAAKTGPDPTMGATAIDGDAAGKEAPAAAAPSPVIKGGTKDGAQVAIRGSTRKEGALVAASPPKGEERALAAASSPPAAEPSGGAVGKREKGAPAAASRPHVAEPSGGAAGKREVTGTMKVKTPPAAEPPRADPAVPPSDTTTATPDLVAAVLDPAATVTC